MLLYYLYYAVSAELLCTWIRKPCSISGSLFYLWHQGGKPRTVIEWKCPTIFFLHARKAKACFTAIENVCLEYTYFVPKGKRGQLSTNWEHMIWIAIMSWHAHGGLSVLKWPCNKFCLGQTKAANHGRINMLLICNCNVRFYKFEAKVAIKLKQHFKFPFLHIFSNFFQFFTPKNSGITPLQPGGVRGRHFTSEV